MTSSISHQYKNHQLLPPSRSLALRTDYGAFQAIAFQNTKEVVIYEKPPDHHQQQNNNIISLRQVSDAAAELEELYSNSSSSFTSCFANKSSFFAVAGMTAASQNGDDDDDDDDNNNNNNNNNNTEKNLLFPCLTFFDVETGSVMLRRSEKNDKKKNETKASAHIIDLDVQQLQEESSGEEDDDDDQQDAGTIVLPITNIGNNSSNKSTEVSSMAFSSDDKFLFIAHHDRSLTVFSVEGRSILKRLENFCCVPTTSAEDEKEEEITTSSHQTVKLLINPNPAFGRGKVLAIYSSSFVKLTAVNGLLHEDTSIAPGFMMLKLDDYINRKEAKIIECCFSLDGQTVITAATTTVPPCITADSDDEKNTSVAKIMNIEIRAWDSVKGTEIINVIDDDNNNSGEQQQQETAHPQIIEQQQPLLTLELKQGDISSPSSSSILSVSPLDGTIFIFDEENQNVHLFYSGKQKSTNLLLPASSSKNILSPSSSALRKNSFLSSSSSTIVSPNKSDFVADFDNNDGEEKQKDSQLVASLSSSASFRRGRSNTLLTKIAAESSHGSFIKGGTSAGSNNNNNKKKQQQKHTFSQANSKIINLHQIIKEESADNDSDGGDDTFSSCSFFRSASSKSNLLILSSLKTGSIKIIDAASSSVLLKHQIVQKPLRQAVRTKRPEILWKHNNDSSLSLHREQLRHFISPTDQNYFVILHEITTEHNNSNDDEDNNSDVIITPKMTFFSVIESEKIVAGPLQVEPHDISTPETMMISYSLSDNKNDNNSNNQQQQQAHQHKRPFYISSMNFAVNQRSFPPSLDSLNVDCYFYELEQEIEDVENNNVSYPNQDYLRDSYLKTVKIPVIGMQQQQQQQSQDETKAKESSSNNNNDNNNKELETKDNSTTADDEKKKESSTKTLVNTASDPIYLDFTPDLLANLISSEKEQRCVIENSDQLHRGEVFKSAFDILMITADELLHRQQIILGEEENSQRSKLEFHHLMKKKDDENIAAEKKQFTEAEVQVTIQEEKTPITTINQETNTESDKIVIDERQTDVVSTQTYRVENKEEGTLTDKNNDIAPALITLPVINDNERTHQELRILDQQTAEIQSLKKQLSEKDSRIQCLLDDQQRKQNDANLLKSNNHEENKSSGTIIMSSSSETIATRTPTLSLHQKFMQEKLQERADEELAEQAENLLENDSIIRDVIIQQEGTKRKEQQLAEKDSRIQCLLVDHDDHHQKKNQIINNEISAASSSSSPPPSLLLENNNSNSKRNNLLLLSSFESRERENIIQQQASESQTMLTLNKNEIASREEMQTQRITFMEQQQFLQRSLEKEKSDKNQEISDLKRELSKMEKEVFVSRTEYERIKREEVERALSHQKKSYDAELQSLKDRNIELEKRLRAESSSENERIKNLRAEHERKQQEQQTQMSNQRKEFERKLDDLRKQNEENLQRQKQKSDIETEDKVQEAVLQLQFDVDEKNNKIQTLEEKVKSQKDAFNQVLQEIKRSSSTQQHQHQRAADDSNINNFDDEFMIEDDHVTDDNSVGGSSPSKKLQLLSSTSPSSATRLHNNRNVLNSSASPASSNGSAIHAIAILQSQHDLEKYEMEEHFTNLLNEKDEALVATLDEITDLRNKLSQMEEKVGGEKNKSSSASSSDPSPLSSTFKQKPATSSFFVDSHQNINKNNSDENNGNFQDEEMLIVSPSWKQRIQSQIPSVFSKKNSSNNATGKYSSVYNNNNDDHYVNNSVFSSPSSSAARRTTNEDPQWHVKVSEMAYKFDTDGLARELVRTQQQLQSSEERVRLSNERLAIMIDELQVREKEAKEKQEQLQKIIDEGSGKSSKKVGAEAKKNRSLMIAEEEESETKNAYNNEKLLDEMTHEELVSSLIKMKNSSSSSNTMSLSPTLIAAVEKDSEVSGFVFAHENFLKNFFGSDDEASRLAASATDAEQQQFIQLRKEMLVKMRKQKMAAKKKSVVENKTEEKSKDSSTITPRRKEGGGSGWSCLS